MSNDLIGLKNLGKTSVQWLNAVGIKTPDQLRANGSVATYCKVRDRGFKVSKVLLYALEGALINTHWNELSSDYKTQLLRKVHHLSNHMNKF
ncbi:MAG: TfoX/Sxy family protein [Endozoicomonas sp. (ex Botrylloides leachii)]|nr:TfoX/Sxy family protein [Endozoicomonas sp. (ex Botrylloides leachii)]